MAGPAAQRPFRFGVQLVKAESPRSYLEKAQRAEFLGYSMVSTPDHMSEQLGPIAAMTAIAMSTSTVRIGVTVLSNDWRNPVLLAKEAATLDWLSSGRLELGMGAGWMLTDYEQLGIPYDLPSVRVDRALEALEILRDLFAGKTVTRRGTHYQIKDAFCFPRPVQRPLPLAVGGGSRKILRGAGRLADTVNIHTNLGAGQAGDTRKREYGLMAVKKRLAWVREGAGDRFDTIELGSRVLAVELTDQRDAAAERIGERWNTSGSDVLVSPHALVGSIDAIVEELIGRREELGFSSVLWNESELERLAPVVKRLAGR